MRLAGVIMKPCKHLKVVSTANLSDQEIGCKRPLQSLNGWSRSNINVSAAIFVICQHSVLNTLHTLPWDLGLQWYGLKIVTFVVMRLIFGCCNPPISRLHEGLFVIWPAESDLTWRYNISDAWEMHALCEPAMRTAARVGYKLMESNSAKSQQKSPSSNLFLQGACTWDFAWGCAKFLRWFG